MRKRLEGHRKGVYALAYDHENTLLFTAGFEHDAYVVRTEDPALSCPAFLVFSFPPRAGDVRNVTQSPNQIHV